MKKITALVSQYNSGEWIEERLINLMESSVANDLEIVCINANSPDPLDDSVPKKFKNVKYIKCPERIGIYEAWNLGLMESTGQYVVNANTDDLVASNCYAGLANILDNHPKVGVTYCSWYTIGATIQRWSQVNMTQGVSQPGAYAGDFNKGQIGHFPMWRRKLHAQIGMFCNDLPSLGDAEFWARVYFKTRWHFEWLRAPLGAFRYRDGQNAWDVLMTDSQWPTLNSRISQWKVESERV